VKIKGVSRPYMTIVKGRVERCIGFLGSIGVDQVTEVTRNHVVKYQDMILKRNTSKHSKRDELLAIVLFFRFLHDYEYIEENPALVIDPPKKEMRIPRNILGEQEIAYLLRLPDQKDLIGIRDFCVMSLLYSSMMRPKEIFNLRLDDIDFRLKQVLVRRPKNKRDRIVHISGYTVFFIKKYLKSVRQWLLKSNNSDHLFISATGSNFVSEAFYAHFKRRYAAKIKEKFGKHVTPYAFRHSSATHWLDSGARKKKDLLPYVQKQLGHESLESTVIYTHVAIEPLREMFRKYHPREISLKSYHKIPSPDDIISPLKD